MRFFIDYINRGYIFFQFILILILISSFSTSCDFVGDELKQDKQLAYYRYQTQLIPDSIAIGNDRIEAYNDLITSASDDKYLITTRKKNKLLSEIYCVVANDCYELGDTRSAIENNTLAIIFNKTNQYAHYNRGCIYQNIGQDSLAVVDYTNAILYDDKFIDAYYNRGMIYEKQADFQLAVEDYSRAIELNPVYVSDIYNNRGNIYKIMNFQDKALKDYNMALERDSTMLIAYCNRGDLFFNEGKFEEALDDYKKANSIDSTNKDIVKNIEIVMDSLKNNILQNSSKKNK